MTAVALQILAGLGIFLFGMACLESGIAGLSGRRMRRWIGRATGSGVSSAGFGALATAILQSSSMVALLVLAFASAGSLPLFNAIGVIIGSNLGTTLKGWVIAGLGIKVDLSAMALPMLGAGGILQVIYAAERQAHHWGRTIAGLGLLLLGLDQMKESVDALPALIDISVLQGHHPVVYLLAGTLLTAIIQSSSATVMLTLSALYGNLISLPEAGALVIGADLGTTSTTVLGSLYGAGIKRQLALAQLVFNAVVDLGAFVFFLPLLPGALALAGITDPLYGVVAFHTTINLLGLALFIPLLGPFSRWINGFFRGPENRLLLMADIDPLVPEAALPVLKQGLDQLLLVAVHNNLRPFSVRSSMLALSPRARAALAEARAGLAGTPKPGQVYEALREQESAIIQLGNKLQETKLPAHQATQLSMIQEIARRVVYASKSMKDINRDIENMRAARRDYPDSVGWLFREQRAFLQQICADLIELVLTPDNGEDLEDALDDLKQRNNHHYEAMNEAVYRRSRNVREPELGLSVQLNVNREVRQVHVNMFKAVRRLRALRELPVSRTGTSGDNGQDGAATRMR